MFQKIFRFSRILFPLVLIALGFFYGLKNQAQSNQNIYTDSLQNGWENWSWASVNLNNTNPVHGGPASVSVNVPLLNSNAASPALGPGSRCRTLSPRD